jgi:NADPH2:quinone reductase
VRAARVHRYGGPDVVTVEDVDAPARPAGTVRVGVEAAGVNFPDLLFIGDRYQLSLPLPFTPGCEFSGSVLEADRSSRVRPGDTVVGTSTDGAFAEEVVVPERDLLPVPPHVDRVDAAAFAVGYVTAYHALVTMAAMRSGDRIVVLGAGGGVGLAAVDVARALGGRVLAAASTTAKLDAARRQGAEAVVDYTDEDLKEAIRRWAPDGADVVVDPVGGPYSEQALRATGWGGRFVVVGFASGEIPAIPLNLVLLKGVHVVGFEHRTILDRLPERAPADRSAAVDLLAEGAVEPFVSAVWPLDDVGAALQHVGSRAAIGKVVIDVTGRGRGPLGAPRQVAKNHDTSLSPDGSAPGDHRSMMRQEPS